MAAAATMERREPALVSLEVFILNQLSSIAQETSGRAQAQKDVREAALKLLEELGVADFGKPGSRLSLPFPPEISTQLLGVLRGALALGNPRLAEPALSCMHKLVAYAYMQGETGPSGRLDDEANLVTQVVALTSKCGESSSPATQLQVVKALLTYATAEHFMAHGDCLMQAVRTVFNIAIGSDSLDIQNTARSALLQMVNTVLKRVGQQILSPHGTPLPSPSPTTFRPWRPTGSSDNVAAAATAAAATPRGPERTSSGVASASSSAAGSAAVSAAASQADLDAAGAEGSEIALPSPSQPLSPAENDQLMEALSAELSAAAPVASSNSSPPEVAGASRRSTGGGLVVTVGQPSSATSSSAGVAEAADVLAAAADIAELQAALPRIQTSPDGVPAVPPREGGEAATTAEQFVAAAVEADARTAQLASLAEQADLRGLERALDSLPQAEPTGRPVAKLQRQDTPPDPRRALMRDRRAAAWKLLTPVERDALIVITAMCKMAARETGLGTVESYMHKGKLLALDLLVRVLTNPMHDWALVRPEFAGELRQPLCLVLLRSCSSPYEAAVTAAVRLFEAVLSAQKLRAGLKAELGALYPLLLLKPIETMPGPEGAHAVAMAAEGLLHTCSHPQVLVDLFVNYDCSLQAANLYERTIKAIRKLMALPEGTAAPFPPADMQKLKATALKALLAAIKSLDTWAGPIKSAAAAVSLTTDAAGPGGAAGPDGAEPNGSGEGEFAAQPRGREELQRILADKELKEALTTGVQLFNTSAVKGLRALVRSGVIPDGSPATAAAFLREHAQRLDKGQVGELFGHHDDHSIAVMHAFIDGERFSGLSLDEALRQLLQGFRLPGEAQKIDRIMEKFAEAYCRDNPAAFKTADGAYLLAFAIIMLNTDAHNPMADRRISSDDFVSMAQCQVEGGGGEGGGEGVEERFEQILPTEELLAIYTRITENEIKVHGEDDAAPAAAPAGKRSGERSRRGARLAAAVGVSQMVLPFWAGATWDKQHGVDVERKRLLEFTRQMMASSSGAVAGNIWHTATHAEHARPMMQVSGDAFLQCLKLALDAAPNMHQALQVLGGYEQAVRLAALLRLEGLCEALVAGLAAAAGLAAPAPHSSAAEAKQVAALSKLGSLGSCSEAGMLGPSWLILLRTLSQLERLQAQLLPGSKDGLPPLPESVAALMASSSLDAVAAAAAAAAAAPPAPLPPPPQAGSSFGRLLQRMGFSSGTEAGGNSAAASCAAATSGRAGLLAIKDAPGAGHVLWAETAGVAPIERIYSGSAGLAGDAVLSFMRALCAVSQEELHPSEPGERPRVSLLQRVVECAYHNMGSRIRLVWSRLWNVVAQHLVSAACHTDAYVAMYAVDALRQLAAKLLDRAELARFTHQGEALRPFAAVLRHSDSPAVRELAVACMAHAVSAHPHGLGSGWRAVVEVLGLATRDASPTVAGQALDALAPVAEALFRPAGHTLLRESTAAVLAGVENPHGHEELSTRALYLFQALARRLDEALLSCAADEVALSLALAEGPRSPTPGERQAAPPAAADPAAAAGRAAPDAAEGQVQERGRSVSQPAEPPLAASSSAHTDLSFSLWRSSSQPLSQPSSAASGAGGDQLLATSTSMAAAQQQQQQGQVVDGVTATWQVLLVPLAAVARVDVRPRVADTAAAVLLQVLKLHGDGLTPQQWLRLYQVVLQPLLALPADSDTAAAAGARLDDAHLPLASPATPTAAASGFPAPALHAAAAGGGSFPEAARRTTTGGGSLEGLPAAVPSVLSFEGLDRLERHASAHMPDICQLLLEGAGAGAAGPADSEADSEPAPLRRGGSGSGSGSLVAGVLQLHRSLSGASSAGSAAGGSSPSGAAARRRLPLLWQPLLGLLQQYICFPAESTAVLGVNQLHHLLLAAAPALDAQAWQAAFVMLQTICLQDPMAADSALGPTSSPGSGSGSSGVPGSLLAAAAAAEGLRRRSRMAILLQRVLDSLLHQRAAAMPGQVQLQLLELLHRTVLAAAALNADVGRRTAAERALLAGAAAAEQAHLASQASALLRQLTGGGEAWAGIAAAAGAAGTAGEAPPAGLVPAPPAADADEVAGGSASGASWEHTLPALVRQEAEGGCLYISALQRCMSAPASSNGTEAAVAAECEARLASFCLWVVAGAAERAAVLSGGEASPVESTAAAASLAAADVAASPGPAAGLVAGRAAINPADQPWEDAVRAPLVDAALHAYAGLSSAAWARQQAAAFPHLAQLVCSPSKGVRRALRSLLQQQVPSVIAAMQASAASGTGGLQ